MPVGISDGKFFEDDFEEVLDSFNKLKTTTPDTMEIDPVTNEEPVFDPTLEAKFIPTGGSDDNLPEPFDIGTIKTKDGPVLADTAEQIVDKTNQRPQLLPERMFWSMVDAFKLPGDVYQGNIDPKSPEAIGRATELAGALIFGPAPMARKVVDGSLGSFAGVSSKTVDHTKLRRANEMERGGAHADDIWEKTGFFKGQDGRWRYEIPETNMQIKDLSLIKKEGSTLGDLIDHPELFKAYPEMKKLPVALDESLNAIAKAGDKLVINPKKIDDERFLKRIITHEIQHVIQRTERFDFKGSNPDFAITRSHEALRNKISDAVLAGNMKEAEELSEIYLYMTRNWTEMGKHLYSRNPGEIEANLSMRRFEMGDNYNPPYRTQEWLEQQGHSKTPLAIKEADVGSQMGYMASRPAGD